MKIYVAQPRNASSITFLTQRAKEEINKLGEVVYNETDKMPDAEMAKKQCPDAQILFIGWGSPKFDAEFLDAIPNLKLIAYMGGSVANLVTDELKKRGIILLSGNRVFAQSVAEGCLAYILVALRRLEYYMKNARKSQWWTNDDFNNAGIIGKRVGLVGFGEVTRFFAQMLSVFNTEVLISSNYLTDEEAQKYGARKATNEEIFSTCDIISIHSALNERTKGSVTRELLGKIKKGALFVNTARGQVVDEEAMVEFLKEKRFNAALDVFSTEPIPPEGHFLTPLLEMENVVLVPHMAGPTLDMREQVVLELVKDIKRFYNNDQLVNMAIYW